MNLRHDILNHFCTLLCYPKTVMTASLHMSFPASTPPPARTTKIPTIFSHSPSRNKSLPNNYVSSKSLISFSFLCIHLHPQPSNHNLQPPHPTSENHPPTPHATMTRDDTPRTHNPVAVRALRLAYRFRQSDRVRVSSKRNTHAHLHKYVDYTHPSPAGLAVSGAIRERRGGGR